jgi:UDP-N-acetyl-D-mannosaminuronic acid dehydrogenase
MEEAIRGANIVVITNNHPVFSAMPLETLSASLGEPALVYDFWNHFEPRNLRLAAGRAYMPLGNHGSTLGRPAQR